MRRAVFDKKCELDSAVLKRPFRNFAWSSLVVGLLCSSDLAKAVLFLGMMCDIRIRSYSCTFDSHLHHIPYQSSDDGTMSTRI